MTPQDAMRQAWMTSSEYAVNSMDQLCRSLGINREEKDWHKNLAPFAVVWAAMITAAAEDFKTAIRSGIVVGHGPGAASE